jgi:hypothetical protein
MLPTEKRSWHHTPVPVVPAAGAIVVSTTETLVADVTVLENEMPCAAPDIVMRVLMINAVTFVS